MRTVLFVLAVLVFVGNSGLIPVTAQTKKGTDPTGVIEIGEGKDGKFRFFVRDDEGKLVAMSSPGGFENVKDAEAEIAKLKAILSKAKVSVLKKDTKDAPAKDKSKDKTK